MRSRAETEETAAVKSPEETERKERGGVNSSDVMWGPQKVEFGTRPS